MWVFNAILIIAGLCVAGFVLPYLLTTFWFIISVLVIIIYYLFICLIFAAYGAFIGCLFAIVFALAGAPEDVLTLTLIIFASIGGVVGLYFGFPEIYKEMLTSFNDFKEALKKGGY